MQNEIIRCQCGQILATRSGPCLFLQWRGRKARVKGAQNVEIVCEKCKRKIEIKKYSRKY